MIQYLLHLIIVVSSSTLLVKEFRYSSNSNNILYTTSFFSVNVYLEENSVPRYDEKINFQLFDVSSGCISAIPILYDNSCFTDIVGSCSTERMRIAVPGSYQLIISSEDVSIASDPFFVVKGFTRIEFILDDISLNACMPFNLKALAKESEEKIWKSSNISYGLVISSNFNEEQMVFKGILYEGEGNIKLKINTPGVYNITLKTDFISSETIFLTIFQNLLKIYSISPIVIDK